MSRRIVASQIAVEWNDKPKLVVLDNDMPDWVREPFDEWLRDIENEENAITEEAWVVAVRDRCRRWEAIL